jgi:C4-dicarboxylate-specific signal transduction histidine kinase
MDVRSPTPEWLERANQLGITARLLPNTVHDVNNALQVIIGSAELLDLVAGADEDVKRRGLAIRTHANRATAILSELMAFARDATDISQRLSLRALVHRALALRRYSLTKLGIRTTVEGEEDAALGNPRYVLQILLNVLINAEQALLGRSGSLIGIRITRSDERALLTIEDNGPGLSADVERRLFSPELGQTGQPGGLGIGLSVSREMAERQGGTLAFAPAPGGGCVFTLTLKAAAAVVA